METAELNPAETRSAPEPPVPEKKKAKKIKPPKKKRRWWKILILVVLILAALVYFLVIRPMNAAMSQLGSGYSQYTVTRQDITVSVSGTATVQPADSYNVTSLVTGEILDAPFEEGATVEKDDLLFTIDSSDVETNIQRAALSVERAQQTYNDALKALDDLTITANASGYIQTLYVEDGDSITIGTPIAEIVDKDTVTLKVPFHSQDAQTFYVGQSAAVAVNGYAQNLTGLVTEIAALDSVTAGGALVRTVTIELSNPGGITDSYTGTAQIGAAACAEAGPFSYKTQKTVTSTASGDISSLPVTEGSWINDGQTLAVVDSSNIDSTINSARIALEDAKLAYQSAVDALDNYTITSPISGQVIEKNYKAGDNLEVGNTANTYMAVIYDLSSLKFEMSIDELDVSKIQVGQEVTITAEALEGQTFTGHVSKININGVTMNGITSYPVTVEIDQAGDLLPGMNVSAEIIVEQVTDVLAVPVDAVDRGNTVTIPGDGCIGKDGSIDVTKLEQTTVTLGRNNEDYIEVTGGLSEGDVILIKDPQASSFMELMMGMNDDGGPDGGPMD